MIHLDPELQRRLGHGDPFATIMSLRGEVYRHVAARETLRVDLEGRSYFVKRHTGVGWWEILKNLLHLRLPVISARNEWHAIRRLEELGIDTQRIAGYGCRGINPARMHSFIITEDLGAADSLEDYCRSWLESPPSPAFRRALIRRVAEIARTLHTHGINHRDFYLCHFLLGQPAAALRLYLIDLHRVQLRRRTPLRWIVKDIGGLCFSSLDIGLTRNDCFRFMATYRGRPLREILREEQPFWAAVENRALRLYRSAFGRAPAGPGWLARWVAQARRS